MTKKRLPTFTLVRRSLLPDVQKSAEKAVMGGIRRQSTDLADRFSKLNKPFTKALFSSVIAPDARSDVKRIKRSDFAKQVQTIARDLTRQKNVLKVGILDLGAWLSGLPGVLERLNAAQGQLTFFEIQAPVPAGLMKKGDWYAKIKGFNLTVQERKELSTQIFANDFFKTGKTLREHFGLDYVVGVTPVMVAGIDAGELYWNHFSTNDGPVLLISTADLRKFAAKANRAFEALVAYLLIGQLLVSMNARLRFHSDRGCLFDYNESRVSIAKAARNPMIEPECLERIDPKNRDTAKALLRVLQRL